MCVGVFVMVHNHNSVWSNVGTMGAGAECVWKVYVFHLMSMYVCICMCMYFFPYQLVIGIVWSVEFSMFCIFGTLCEEQSVQICPVLVLKN